MPRKKTKNKRIKPNPHLAQTLKSSYDARLNWLEEAHKFILELQKTKILKHKKIKR